MSNVSVAETVQCKKPVVLCVMYNPYTRILRPLENLEILKDDPPPPPPRLVMLCVR